MAYPDVDEFKRLLIEQPLDDVVKEHVFIENPYVFRGWPGGLNTLRGNLSRSLGLTATNIVIAGSGAVGFSLSPTSFGKKFGSASDLDVVIVDDVIFDEVWAILLRWNYPRRRRLAGVDWEWARLRQEDVYWGWFEPHRMKFSGLSFPSVLEPLRDLRVRWFNAFQSLSLDSRFSRRQIGGRLYRTWEHALLYHVSGLQLIANQIRAEQG